MIQNYDTNGLIFIIHPENVDETFESETYRKAVLNVLNSQGKGFFCIPIISHPRIRNNRNDSITRATYEPSEGKVTHIARKGVFDDEDEIVFIPNQEIEHISGDSSLLEAVKLIFTPNSLGSYNFVVTVDGSKEQPIALLSPDQILQKSCKKELISRLLDLCDQEKTKLLFSITEQIVEGGLDKSELDLAGLNDIDLSNDEIEKHGTRRPSLPTRREGAPLNAKHIMSWGACAVKIKDLKNLDVTYEYLSVELLSKANDFTNLIVLDKENNIQGSLVKITKDKDENKRLDVFDAVIVDFDTDYELMLRLFDPLISKNENSAIIVNPEKNILTGEGEMQWPGIVTLEEFICAELFNKIDGVLTKYERQLIDRVFLLSKEKKVADRKICLSNRPTPIEMMNLGKLLTFFNNKNRYQLGIKMILDYFTNQDFEHTNIQRLNRWHGKVKHIIKAWNVDSYYRPEARTWKAWIDSSNFILNNTKLPDFEECLSKVPEETLQNAINENMINLSSCGDGSKRKKNSDNSIKPASRKSAAEVISKSQEPYVEKAKSKSSSNRQSSPSNNPKKPKIDTAAIKTEIGELKKELSEIPAERLKQHELDPRDIAAKNAITTKEWELKRKISELEKLLQ